VISDRSNVVKSIIAKQANRGTFPILAYSYYEYANSLKAGDKYSALLYLGYALELGSLDIYFEKQTLSLPKFNEGQLAAIHYIIYFCSGVFIGITAGILIGKRMKKRR
jgi:predicted S18 family serine protease